MHKVYYGSMVHRLEDSLVSDDNTGLDRAVREEKTLFYGSSVSGEARQADIVVLDLVDGIKSQYGWTFQKDSELTEMFNYHLTKIFETGVFVRLIRVSTATLLKNYYTRYVFLLISEMDLQPIGGLFNSRGTVAWLQQHVVHLPRPGLDHVGRLHHCNGRTSVEETRDIY